MTILEGLMKLHGITVEDLAAQLGISTKTCDRRLKGISEWKIRDINIIIDIFHIEPQFAKLLFLGDLEKYVNNTALEVWVNKLRHLTTGNISQ